MAKRQGGSLAWLAWHAGSELSDSIRADLKIGIALDNFLAPMARNESGRSRDQARNTASEERASKSSSERDVHIGRPGTDPGIDAGA